MEDGINYINNFIGLRKNRLDRTVKLKYNMLGTIPALQIAPTLRIPLVEMLLRME